MEAELPELVDHKHITFVEKRLKWRVQMRVNGKMLNLGEHGSLDDALLIRAIAYEELGWNDPSGTDTSHITDDDVNEGGKYYELVEKVSAAKLGHKVDRSVPAEDRVPNVRNPKVRDLIAKVDKLETQLLELTRIVHTMKREHDAA